MRNRAITAIAAAAAALLSGCAVAPAPPPGKPAPRLPADSIAYDTLPVIKSRPKLFPGDCSQFEKNPELLGSLGGSSPMYNPYAKSCVLTRSAGIEVEVGSMDPDQRIPEPWPGWWKAYDYNVHHFRRMLLLDRYYAVSQLDRYGCLVAVNTGSLQVVTVRVGAKTGAGPVPGDSVDADRQTAELFCPDAQKAAETYLNTVDPGGGSLAG
ncbi:hypothetical protein [Amycolatopsis sp. La24]|uniref:hypothetical protein n=1 Tax=Amycolatopsis sp. La24 TaxID=3028304 RepID=UPI0023B0E521|nr:hypothetical protein [Amycolatopsis sp. La24]